MRSVRAIRCASHGRRTGCPSVSALAPATVEGRRVALRKAIAAAGGRLRVADQNGDGPRADGRRSRRRGSVQAVAAARELWKVPDGGLIGRGDECATDTGQCWQLDGAAAAVLLDSVAL